MYRLEPKLVTVFREGYPRTQLLPDLGAGLVVGIVALPLAIAFAIASGVGPERGLYTAVVAGFLISLLSGSRVQIGGPTGAFVVLVYGIVQHHGYDGLVVATLLAGLILIVMGCAQLGTLIQYIPYPVTIGFTTGIAVIIASGQIRDALGLEMGTVPAAFVPKIQACAHAIQTINPWAGAVAGATVLIVLLLPRLVSRLPGSLAALFATTAAVRLLHLPVETIGDRFGAMPVGLPMPRIPVIDWATVPALFSPALSIALLAGIESLLSAVVADGMTGGRHRPNMELVAQGVANIASPLFGGIPATGAIARTATNVKSGGRTPVAGLTHAVVVLIVLMAAGRWAALIPMATLAGILLIVAWHMSERHLFWAVIRRSTRSDAVVLATTFLLTVLIDLTVAIQAGVVLASLLFMRRMAEVTQVRALTGMLEDSGNDAPERAKLPPGVDVFEVHGSFFFGAAHKFKTTLRNLQRRPRVLVLHIRDVLALDATGLRVLEELHKESVHEGTALVLSGAHAQPLTALARSGLLDRLGEKNVTADLESALTRAREIVSGEISNR
jgi:SulP family sulfate permease